MVVRVQFLKKGSECKKSTILFRRFCSTLRSTFLYIARSKTARAQEREQTIVAALGWFLIRASSPNTLSLLSSATLIYPPSECTDEIELDVSERTTWRRGGVCGGVGRREPLGLGRGDTLAVVIPDTF